MTSRCEEKHVAICRPHLPSAVPQEVPRKTCIAPLQQLPTRWAIDRRPQSWGHRSQRCRPPQGAVR